MGLTILSVFAALYKKFRKRQDGLRRDFAGNFLSRAGVAAKFQSLISQSFRRDRPCGRLQVQGRNSKNLSDWTISRKTRKILRKMTGVRPNPVP